jgi:BirA family biotin operon repressor/biotin-[acetyl-CoA-carboxylase] ligase
MARSHGSDATLASSERIAHARGLLVALADGRLHSGAELARALGVTRAAVWKQLSRLKNCGLAVEAIRGRGYRLRRPLDLLDENRVRRELELAAVPPIGRLESFLELESTNAHLLSRSAPTTGQMEVCLAEYQSAGRGRRGRRWSAVWSSDAF